MQNKEDLISRIREKLKGLPNIEEKRMVGGLVFMYNGKMCVGIMKGDLMCRIDPDLHEAAIKEKGVQAVDFIKRPGSGYIQLDKSRVETQQDFDHWINLALEFNKKEKPSREK